MASINKAIIVGNVGRDAEARYLPNGDAVTKFSIATQDKWKDKATGEQRENTEWHNITIFGKLAEIAAQYVKKGSQVYIEGKIKTKKYTDKDGVERYSTEIHADVMQLLGSRPEGQQQSRRAETPQRQGAQRQPSFSDMDDDIPFANPYRGKYCYVV